MAVAWLLRFYGHDLEKGTRIMPVITILIYLIIAGVLLLLIHKYLRIDKQFKLILTLALVIIFLLFMLNSFGTLHLFPIVKVGKVHYQ